MTRFIPTLVFLFGCILLLNSQTYYVKYDPGCFDRYELVTDDDSVPYIAYTAKNSDGQAIVQMDIGKEPTKWVKTLPSRLTDCNELSYDKALVLAINNSNVKLYFVRENSSNYNISPVEKATFFYSNSNSFEVTMSDADFSMDWNKMYSNRNLATPASTNGIFLDGTIKYQCLTGYIFRKKESYQTDLYKEYIIVPEMGIVNKRSVPFEGAATKPLRLEKIGEIPFIEFIAYKCDNAEFENLKTKSKSNTTEPVTQYDLELTAKGGGAVPTSYANSPCGPPTKSGTHIVQKGETLYSISKKYGITVDQLKAWNNIGSNNLINVCQELVVKLISETTTVGTSTSGGTTNANPTNIAPVGTAGQTQFHIVRPNESVTQLAAMYGYTEERFRKMNSLGTYERVYAGQKLFTTDCNCPNTEGVAADVPMPYDLIESERLTSQGNPDVYFRPIKVHKVQDNETLFSIALLYDTTVDRISELNGIDKNAKLNKDQRLYVQ